MSRLLVACTAVAISSIAAGCEEFSTPAELDRDQILAIAAEPPSVGLGGRSAISLLVAGPDGELEPSVTWSVMALAEGILPVGSVEVDGDGAVTYVAPTERPAEIPTAGLVRAEVALPDRTLVGVKVVVVGNLELENPILTGFTADHHDLLAEPEVTVALGDTVTIAADIEPPATDDTMFAWYSTLGTIDMYRSSPTELLADQAGEGWLFVVVRDGMGGETWRKAHLIVTD